MVKYRWMKEEETRRLLGKLAFREEDVKGKKILLHVCCAPDATTPIKWLAPLAQKLACYFYDPNIYPPDEYLKRLYEMRKLAEKWQVKTIEGKYFNTPIQTVCTDFVVPEHHILQEGYFDTERIKPVNELEEALIRMMEGGSYEDVLVKFRHLADEPEGGARCRLCFDLRLTRTAGLASILGFEAFATTLTISPKKDADMVNCSGDRAGRRFGVSYIWTNFKKHEGFRQSAMFSQQLGMYRQKYCGCKHSQKQHS